MNVASLQAVAPEQGVVPGGGIVAHFVAHGAPVADLCFDPSGGLLLTADVNGGQ